MSSILLSYFQISSSFVLTPSVCLSVCLSASLFLSLFIYLSLSLPIHFFSICLCLFRSKFSISILPSGTITFCLFWFVLFRSLLLSLSLSLPLSVSLSVSLPLSLPLSLALLFFPFALFLSLLLSLSFLCASSLSIMNLINLVSTSKSVY